MAGQSHQASREPVVRTVVRRFPFAEFAIRKHMNRSEAFCDMCEELAEAELALRKVSELPPEIREARRIEWQELVDRLVAEIAAALREGEAWQSRKASK